MTRVRTAWGWPRWAERARGRRGTVLVVDGRRTVVAALEGEGYRVLTATGLEALGVAHELQPDVVVLDATGPGHDRAVGELARRLRELGPTELIPLVALGAQGRPRAALPVNEVVLPPCTMDEVAAIVACWLPAA